MSEETQETIVINDILCLLSCMHNHTSSDGLLKIIQKHYSSGAIVDACETLQESDPEIISDAIMKPKSIPKALEAIIAYMQSMPSEARPIFVSKNINDLPKLTFKKRRSKTSKKRENLKEEFHILENKIVEISSFILQLKRQLQEIASNSLSDMSLKKIKNISYEKHKHSSGNNPKTGLAYLQHLIDEEDKKNDLRPPAKKYMRDEENETLVSNAYPLEVCQSSTYKKDSSCRTKKSRKKVKHIHNNNSHITTFKSLEAMEDDPCSDASSDKKFEISSDRNLIQINMDDVENPSKLKMEDDEYGHRESSKKNILDHSFFICPFCKFQSECRETLHKHLGFHSYSNISPPNSEDDLTSVIKSEANVHQCLLCLEEFPQKSLLEEHINKCPTITFEADFTYPDASDKHFCYVCKVVFSSRFSLISHSGYHDKARAFSCSVCGYRFYTKENLDNHYKVHTEGIYKCPYCEYGNAFKTRVISHIHCHTGYKPYNCTICNYKTASHNALVRHLSTHSDKRDFSCTDCDASFKTKDKLHSHKKIHQKSKPYKCPECGKCFKVPTAMKVHYRIHTDYKPHACPICPYKARTAAVLRIHSNIHSKEKPFKCDLCDFKANQKSYLSWHMKAYHPLS